MVNIPKDDILEELRNTVTDVQQYVPSSSLIDECVSVVPLNVDPFHARGKSPTVGIYSEYCSAATITLHSKGRILKLKSIRQYRSIEND